MNILSALYTWITASWLNLSIFYLIGFLLSLVILIFDAKFMRRANIDNSCSIERQAKAIAYFSTFSWVFVLVILAVFLNVAARLILVGAVKKLLKK